MTSNIPLEGEDMDVFTDIQPPIPSSTSDGEKQNKNTSAPESKDELAASEEKPSHVNNEYKPMAIKKKHRRGSRRNKKRKYKPYSELTWEEKKAVEERDSRRAVSIRKKYMHEKGRPLAPFNTSQFLMAEHDTEEPDLHISHHHHHEQHARLSSSADDSDYGESSLSDEEHDIEEVRNFLQKDFTETYDRLHSELLHTMNKDQLVSEYMQLEDKVESLEKELAVIKSGGTVNSVVGVNGILGIQTPPVSTDKVLNENHNENTEPENETCRENLQHEVKKLREENMQLHHENDKLRPKVEPQNYNHVHTI